MSDQPYDYGREPARQDPNQTTRQPPPTPPYQQANRPPPAPPYQGSRQAQLMELHRPFVTGMMLGFGFMAAAVIVSVVLSIVFAVLGVGLAGVFSQAT